MRIVSCRFRIGGQIPVLVRLDTELSTRVWNILDYLQAQCEYRRAVIVVSPNVSC